MRNFSGSVFVAVVAISLTLGQPLTSEARIVFDPLNYAQNLLEAARALEQIHNQIRSLRNEARMLENMARDLTPLDYSSLQVLTNRLQRIESLIGEAEGLSFAAQETKIEIDRYYKAGSGQDLQADRLLKDAEMRWDQALGAWRTALTLQSDIVGDIARDKETLTALVAQSQSAVGALQAEQAGNQLLAMSGRQQLQIQILLAAQFRADALEKARRDKEQEAADATTERFLGRGSAYTPY